MIKINERFGREGQNMEITAEARGEGWRVTVRNTAHRGMTWRHAITVRRDQVDGLIGRVAQAISEARFDVDSRDDAGPLWAPILPDCEGCR